MLSIDAENIPEESSEEEEEEEVLGDEDKVASATTAAVAAAAPSTTKPANAPTAPAAPTVAALQQVSASAQAVAAGIRQLEADALIADLVTPRLDSTEDISEKRNQIAKSLEEEDDVVLENDVASPLSYL